MSQEDVLSQTYARGDWSPAPQHNTSFTSQADPADTNSGRNMMRYSKYTTRMGHTCFNEWPVPMYQLAQMTKITSTEHDSIFALDAPVDKGAEDGARAAMVTNLEFSFHGNSTLIYGRK